jgi:hypothetical protein
VKHHLGDLPGPGQNFGAVDWDRTFAYSEASQLDAAATSNRLTGSTVSGVTETFSTGGDGYDPHGNMLRLPHLPLMQWDYKDQLRATSQQIITGGIPETTYYVYDSTGQRVRKVTERPNGTRRKERIYLGGFELYREYGGTGNAVDLEREMLHVMDDKRRVTLVETRTQGSEPSLPSQTIRYQFDNHLSSASLEVDQSGAVTRTKNITPMEAPPIRQGAVPPR